jgi:hypothetical protein
MSKMPSKTPPLAASQPANWPRLDYADWADTCTTVHLWTQVIGKIKLALAPPENHWWGIALHVTARGLTTLAMPCQGGLLQIDFDFVHHWLTLRRSEGRSERFRLAPYSVAEFYHEVMGRLRTMGVEVPIWTMPVEIPDAIPFEQDRVHASYDAAAVETFWRQLSQADRVFNVFRGRYLGKCSPVHFFWGSFDLAVTRFSGRTAPPMTRSAPNLGNWVMQEAYSHEVSSCGFWPGNGGYGKAAFYCYAYPEPAGFAQTPGLPQGATYDAALGEFVLPYDVVAQASSPDDCLLEFLQSTYAGCADCGTWERGALERSTVK